MPSQSRSLGAEHMWVRDHPNWALVASTRSFLWAETTKIEKCREKSIGDDRKKGVQLQQHVWKLLL